VITGTLHPLPALPAAQVSLEEGQVRIAELVVADAGLAELLAAQPPADWPALVERALAVGARGLLTMGIGLDLANIDARVQRTLEGVVAEAERRVQGLLDQGRRAFGEHFDPERRTSLLGRALDDFTRWRDEMLRRLDPDAADSHTAAFLARLGDLLGPGGAIEQRLGEALDPEADGSALSRLAAGLDARFTALHDLIVHARGRDEGRAEEAARGTAQGFDFEDLVEERLRAQAGAIGGCVVERTARVKGSLGPNAAVGDFLVTLPTRHRLVVEAKNQAALTLTGVLTELDQAMANRQADFAVCVSARPAFPTEVGMFGVYGNRLLVVDDGDGALTSVALRWAVAALTARAAGAAPGLDAALLADRIDRIRRLAERFKSGQRSLTDAGKSLDSVRESLAAMRAELVDLADDIHREVTRATPD